MVKSLHCIHVRALTGIFFLLGLTACAGGAPGSSADNTSAKLDAPTSTVPPANTITEQVLPVATAADDSFREARDAFRRKDAQKLAALEPLTANHPLGAYVTYWKLFTILRAQPDDPQAQRDLSRFIAQHNGEYVAERARTDWARLASSKEDFDRFNALWAQLQWNKTEPDFVCDRAYLALANPTPTALANAKATMIKSNMGQGSCRRLGRKIVDLDSAWSRSYLLVLLQKKQFAFAAMEVRRLPANAFGVPSKNLLTLLNNPTTWYSRNKTALAKQSSTMLAYAGLRLAPVSRPLASTVMNSATGLDDATKALVWGRIGFESSVDMEPEALQWYAQAGSQLGKSPLTVDKDQILSWQTRAALLAGNWQTTASSIAAMTPAGQKDDAWTYWKAKANLALGTQSDTQGTLQALCQKPNFYGLLACDEIKAPYPAGQMSLQPPASKFELARMEVNPSIHRALAFYALDLVWDGNREWNWAQRGMSKRDLAVMAEFAGSKGLAHRMISTSQRSGQFIFPQVFPQVHKQEIEKAAQEASLPAEWVFGLIHQESRFIPVVSSSVGAQGLMQVMPGTARWLAKRIDDEDFQNGRLTPMQSNLLLGTTYMKMVADAFGDNPAMVAASYNAGPGKAQVWRAALPKATPGAVFAEIIPYGETRSYVKNVTANITEYSRYEKNPVRLTNLLGVIEPTPVVKNLLP